MAAAEHLRIKTISQLYPVARMPLLWGLAGIIQRRPPEVLPLLLVLERRLLAGGFNALAERDLGQMMEVAVVVPAGPRLAVTLAAAVALAAIQETVVEVVAAVPHANVP